MFRRVISQNPYTFSQSWREMDRLQREMNRLFSEFGDSSSRMVAPAFPAMNVWSNEEGVVVTAELPGVNPDNVDISVTGDVLTISGHRSAEDLGENGKFHRRERNHGNFNRTIQLPFNVETEKVEAMFEKGILHVSLPRHEAEKPRKIAIKMA